MKNVAIILNSYISRGHLRTCYQEYLLAHERENVEELMEKGNFPDIPLTLITHSSEYAIEESMKFGNNSRDFATKIENMWQDIMKEYLGFSKNVMHVQAEHSGHYIHLTEPELIVSEAKKCYKSGSFYCIMYSKHQDSFFVVCYIKSTKEKSFLMRMHFIGTTTNGKER